jgi:outer membrane immunogenic protein
MKKILSAVALLTLGLALPAAAADLPARTYSKAPAVVPPPIYNWGGFYIGANGGGGSSHKCWDFNTLPGVFVAEGCHDATGGLAGGQIGYRWQMSNFVFGVEAQGDWANLRGSNVSQLFPAFTNISRIDGIGLFTGQVGVVFNNVLLYAKGGAAVVADRFRVNTTVGNILTATTPDDTRWGGTAGVGVEFGFAPNWSVAAEYNHLWMQDRTYRFTDTFGAFFAIDRIRQDVDMGTLKVNYHFGGPVVAKY